MIFFVLRKEVLQESEQYKFLLTITYCRCGAAPFRRTATWWLLGHATALSAYGACTAVSNCVSSTRASISSRSRSRLTNAPSLPWETNTVHAKSLCCESFTQRRRAREAAEPRHPSDDTVHLSFDVSTFLLHTSSKGVCMHLWLALANNDHWWLVS